MVGKMLNKKFNRTTRIAVIEIDTPGSGANILNKQFFEELKEIIDRAETDTAIKGIVFTTKKKKIFLAGADLVELQSNLDNPNMLHVIIAEGQELFTRLKNLHVPTVAAIHGMCLGGGLEFALACDARIASDDPSTKIGLPEVMLGILPAWGGCTRLLRLIGVIKSLKFILSGTPKPSNVCKKLGIVDKIECKENLVEEAVKLCKKIHRKKPKLTSIFNSIIFKKARGATLSKTKGNYPAPEKIIEVLSKSTKLTEEKSFLLEANAFVELTQTDACRNLIRIFFLQEKAKKLPAPTINQQPLTDAVVIGAGIMGSGIAQWLSCKKINVLLKDISTKQISTGLRRIGSLYVDGALKHKFDRPFAKAGLARISSTTSTVSLKNKDIIIEAATEKFDIKTQILQDIESQCSDDTILATNTSALSITDLSKRLQRPENFIGIHFFNPVHKMKLVEIVKGESTSQETINRAVSFVKSIGKLPIVVKDRPGFLVNRILLPYLIKAMWLSTLGCDIEEIDKKMVKFGMPMGPFRLLDEIGLDVGIHVAKDLADRLPHMSRLGILDDILALGHYGKKTGKGFYIYKRGKKIGPNKELINMLTLHKDSPVEDVVDTLVQVMIDEAERCLEEEVVDSADIVDFSMIMGTGWAPFRGGPLQYAKQFKI
jgi:3-hydroxyacyl-CoA dehydrogenase / enoyl-CoA hydratase / 3-hydroxybutyryl-CoA epimerase